MPPLIDMLEADYIAGTLFDKRRTGTAKVRYFDGQCPARKGEFPDLEALGIRPQQLTKRRCRALVTILQRSGPEALGEAVGGPKRLLSLQPELRGLSHAQRAAEFTKRWAEHLARKSQEEAKPLKQADVDFSAT